MHRSHLDVTELPDSTKIQDGVTSGR